jgi:hypothetical protein
MHVPDTNPLKYLKCLEYFIMLLHIICQHIEQLFFHVIYILQREKRECFITEKNPRISRSKYTFRFYIHQHKTSCNFPFSPTSTTREVQILIPIPLP